MLIHAPIFKHTLISTLGKERRSRLGEKLNPQFESSVSTFDDYCVLIVQFSREKINIFKASSIERGEPGASLYTDNHWWIRKTNMAARQFRVSLLASRWSQITDSTTKNMNFQALFEVQEMFFFFFFFLMADLLYIELPCIQSDSMQVWATCIDHSNDWLFLKSAIILHELRHILSQTRSHGDNFGASNIEHGGKFM